MFLSLTWVSADGHTILASRAVRTFAYGFVSVLLGIYLEEKGLSDFQIGAIFTLALVGSAVGTIIAGLLTDRLGRRRFLLVFGVLMAASGLAFALSDSFYLLALFALTGTLTPSGGEVGPFLSLEQTMLPQTSDFSRRTHLFALYNLMGTFAGALGALFSGTPRYLESWLDLEHLAALRLMLLVYAGLAVVSTLLFARLSPAVELGALAARASGHNPGRFGLHRSRRRVAGLAALFSLDSLGGGFVVQSLVALFFFRKFGVSLDTLGVIFFVSGLLSAVSFLVAARLASRIGLINTMVFTHIPSSVFLILVPVAPTLPLALALYLARQSLSQMDVAPRQSYIVSVVEPEERAAAVSFTNVSRTIASAISPVMAGYVIGAVSAGVPFLLGGGIKILFDLLLFVFYRNVPPRQDE